MSSAAAGRIRAWIGGAGPGFGSGSGRVTRLRRARCVSDGRRRCPRDLTSGIAAATLRRGTRRRQGRPAEEDRGLDAKRVRLSGTRPRPRRRQRSGPRHGLPEPSSDSSRDQGDRHSGQRAPPPGIHPGRGRVHHRAPGTGPWRPRRPAPHRPRSDPRNSNARSVRARAAGRRRGSQFGPLVPARHRHDGPGWKLVPRAALRQCPSRAERWPGGGGHPRLRRDRLGARRPPHLRPPNGRAADQGRADDGDRNSRAAGQRTRSSPGAGFGSIGGDERQPAVGDHDERRS